MARFVANVDITTETFGQWVTRTNTLLDALSNEIITANTTVGSTGNTVAPRYGQLIGTFSSNTVGVVGSLRGGNTSTSANLSVTSNVVISNTTFTSSANSTYSNTQYFIANVFVNSTLLSVNGTTMNVTSNAVFNNRVTFNGPVFVANTLTIKDDYVMDAGANTNIGSNSAPQVIYTFPKASYRSGKLMVFANNNNGVDTINQMAEMVLAHDGNNAYITVYGVVASPHDVANTTAPLGTFSAQINNANVEVLMTQTYSNSAVKVVAHLIK